MDALIEDYTAKNFNLKITGALFALNHGIDFAGLLDADEAMGARILVESIKMIDKEDIEDWEIYGWFGDQRFGDDFDGHMEDGTSFFNETYFINEMKMDDLWMHMPCMKITEGETFAFDGKHVFIGMIMAPYERTTIMKPALIHEMVIRNEEGFPFPGNGATIKVINENYIRKGLDHERLYELEFRVPQTYYIRYKEDGKWKSTWWFITPKDIDEMHEILSKMRREEME